MANGTVGTGSAVGIATAYIIGLGAALVPALASIYNPHQYSADPLFEPAAVQSVLIAVAIAVPLAWLFGRRWSRKLVSRLVGAGVGLTVIAIVLLVVAGSQPMQTAGPWLVGSMVSATIAIPCCALLTHAILEGKRQ